jgi:hypothetical protein
MQLCQHFVLPSCSLWHLIVVAYVAAFTVPVMVMALQPKINSLAEGFKKRVVVSSLDLPSGGMLQIR